jgi:hypothetical protein
MAVFEERAKRQRMTKIPNRAKPNGYFQEEQISQRDPGDASNFQSTLSFFSAFWQYWMGSDQLYAGRSRDH